MSSLVIDKIKEFNELLDAVKQCKLCARLCNMKKVLSKYNGSLDSKVIFIAEAPGRLGAESTGIPLCGDKTGENFETILSTIGWNREDIFITNAILCNPQDEKGNNCTPKKGEIRNCSYFLERTIKIIDPDIIVTLGAKALEALKVLSDHNYILREHVGTCVDWNGRKLLPLYHNGPRALIRRSFASQREDFIKLSNLVDPINGIKGKNTATQKQKDDQLNNRLLSLSKIIVDYCKELSLVKLNYLLYLIDLKYLDKTGQSVSRSIYLRTQEGPWIPSLKSIISFNEEYFCTYSIRKKLSIRSSENPSSKNLFSTSEKSHIHSVLEKYTSYSDEEIKAEVYNTDPMKFILGNEEQGIEMMKVPVIYNDDTVIKMYNRTNQKKQSCKRLSMNR